jgi:hypothetical protein
MNIHRKGAKSADGSIASILSLFYGRVAMFFIDCDFFSSNCGAGPNIEES